MSKTSKLERNIGERLLLISAHHKAAVIYCISNTPYILYSLNKKKSKVSELWRFMMLPWYVGCEKYRRIPSSVSPSPSDTRQTRKSINILEGVMPLSTVVR